METKLVEIRDRGTFIPAMAFRVIPGQEWLLDAAGYRGYADSSYPSGYVLLIKLSEPRVEYDPLFWSKTSRTMMVAHDYLLGHWTEVEPGGIVDVEFILGETAQPKESEKIVRMKC